MENMEYFLEVFGRLPRAGPGSTACTRRAFEMLTDVPPHPRILDIGCGPGVQTVDLLTLSGGDVVALDFLPLMIERTQAAAARAGVAERLQVLQQDMAQMDFPPGHFDIVWSEGAIYNMGFENGLKKVKSVVRPGGYVAVSDAVWLKTDPPAPVVALWKPYPEMDTIANKLAVIERAGYQMVGHFVLPANTWRVDYYDPMEKLVAVKSKEWAGIPEGMAVVEEARHEIEMHRQFAEYYSYAFFVMRRP